MSRATVRTAVKDYFLAAGLPLVGEVFAARPTIIAEQEYEKNSAEYFYSENGSGAALVVNIPSDKRQRVADTGRGAVNDKWVHKIALEVWFSSTCGEGVPAQEDYDTVIDAIVTLIRANATLGSEAIWSAGEYDAGIDHQQSQPFTDADGLVVFIPGAVMFDAYEWVAGPV